MGRCLRTARRGIASDNVRYRQPASHSPDGGPQAQTDGVLNTGRVRPRGGEDHSGTGSGAEFFRSGYSRGRQSLIGLHRAQSEDRIETEDSVTSNGVDSHRLTTTANRH